MIVTNRTMKYISLFTGIGGFEVAIHEMFPDAQCLGYSEVKTKAIDVYTVHFPSHPPLGDITKITDDTLDALCEQGVDLLVAGFPCTNLTSLATINGNSDGLEGPKSGLFYSMLRIIRRVKPTHIVVENNFSMAKRYRTRIDDALRSLMAPTPVYRRMINAADFGVQTRKRLFWTTFEVPDADGERVQTWDDVLEPRDAVLPFALTDKFVKCLNRPHNKVSKRFMTVGPKNDRGLRACTWADNGNSRWGNSMISDTMSTQRWKPYPVGKSRPYISSNGGTNNVLLDRRFDPAEDQVFPRHFTQLEGERLFHFPDGYTASARFKTTRINLLGNSVVVGVIRHIMSTLAAVR